MSNLPVWKKPLNGYSIVKPYGLSMPWYTSERDNWDKETAKKHFEWFVKSIPERIAVLEQVVQNNPPAVNFNADFSINSLDPLSDWLNTKASFIIPTLEEQKIRIRHLEEHAKKRRLMAKSIHDNGVAALLESLKKDVGEPRPSEVTLSLIFDTGMYVGEMLIKTNPDKLTWDYSKKAPRYINHNKPTVKLPEEKGVGYRGISFIDVFRPSPLNFENNKIDLKNSVERIVQKYDHFGLKLPS